MTAEFSVAEQPIGASIYVDMPLGNQYYFDPLVTVLSQYANSPVILAWVDDFAQWLDPKARFDQFFNLIWNVDSAQGYGLDVWGRIVGVGRVLQVPEGSYLGFVSDPAAQTFGHGIFYSGGRATSNVALTDAAYRTLILAKALLNITDGSIPAINQILLNLFGDGYVRDNLDMSLTYVFSVDLTPVQRAIVFQSGVLPKPAGVSFTVEQP
jgi:hypothetical protein